MLTNLTEVLLGLIQKCMYSLKVCFAKHGVRIGPIVVRSHGRVTARYVSTLARTLGLWSEFPLEDIEHLRGIAGSAPGIVEHLVQTTRAFRYSNVRLVIRKVAEYFSMPSNAQPGKLARQYLCCTSYVESSGIYYFSMQPILFVPARFEIVSKLRCTTSCWHIGRRQFPDDQRVSPQGT